MRPFVIVVAAPSLHLFLRVGKREEPGLVQALRPGAAIIMPCVNSEAMNEHLNEIILRDTGNHPPDERRSAYQPAGSGTLISPGTAGELGGQRRQLHHAQGHDLI